MEKTKIKILKPRPGLDVFAREEIGKYNVFEMHNQRYAILNHSPMEIDLLKRVNEESVESLEGRFHRYDPETGEFSKIHHIHNYTPADSIWEEYNNKLERLGL